MEQEYQEYEDNYFLKKLNSLDRINREDVFTEVDNYNSVDITDENETVTDKTANYNPNQPWGQNDNNDIVINVIDNSYWNNFYGYGYYNNWRYRNWGYRGYDWRFRGYDWGLNDYNWGFNGFGWNQNPFGILIKTIMLGIKIITIHTTNNLTTIGLETLIEMATIGKIPPIVQTLITEDERLATLLTKKTNLLIQELQEEEVVRKLIKNWKKQ